MKDQGIEKVCSFSQGFIISGFFFIYFTIIGLKKIVHYIEDFVKSGFHHIYLPVILNTGLPRGTVPDGILVPCEVPSLPNPTHKGWPRHQGLRPLLFPLMWVFFKSNKNKSVKVLWDGTYGFSSLSEKTRKSNHFQMSLQRLHFLLSHLKTPSVSPAGGWIRDLLVSRPALFLLS